MYMNFVWIREDLSFHNLFEVARIFGRLNYHKFFRIALALPAFCSVSFYDSEYYSIAHPGRLVDEILSQMKREQDLITSITRSFLGYPQVIGPPYNGLVMDGEKIGF